VRDKLRSLKVDEVNAAIRKYLQADNIQFVFITKDAKDLKKRLSENTPSPITYDSAQPVTILDEDKIIEKYQLDFEEVRIVPVGDVFR
jgi:zinc protease